MIQSQQSLQGMQSMNSFHTELKQYPIDYEQYASITQTYPIIQIARNSVENYKIRYMNPDNYEKKLKVTSSHPIVEIKNPTMSIGYKSASYIRLKIAVPDTPAYYDCFIAIQNLRNNEVEEVLKLTIDVLNDNEIGHSG
ncbi:MAG: hypothetical protein MJ252_05075 [archaeon]|nr:hypothetical protein [archaeon]